MSEDKRDPKDDAALILQRTAAARPMLSIPKLDQFIQLILNEERAAHLGVGQ